MVATSKNHRKTIDGNGQTAQKTFNGDGLLKKPLKICNGLFKETRGRKSKGEMNQKQSPISSDLMLFLNLKGKKSKKVLLTTLLQEVNLFAQLRIISLGRWCTGCIGDTL